MEKINNYLDYDFTPFYKDLHLKSKEIKNNLTRGMTRNLGTILSVPDIEFEKAKQDGLEFTDNYLKIMEKRIERSNFLEEKERFNREFKFIDGEFDKMVNKNSGIENSL